uniref:Uncharacterized protein n=1 Tax=Rhizophora mucronata TaxID=61149 RepID=A0A2P2P3V6_RHIMU
MQKSFDHQIIHLLGGRVLCFEEGSHDTNFVLLNLISAL